MRRLAGWTVWVAVLVVAAVFSLTPDDYLTMWSDTTESDPPQWAMAFSAFSLWLSVTAVFLSLRSDRAA